MATDSVAPGNSRFYAYTRGGALLGEYTVSGGSPVWRRDVIYLGGRAIAEADAAGIHELHVDHLGTPRVITNRGTGMIEGRQAYASYGEKILTDGYVPLTGYTGHLQGDPTGLIYMRGRFYSPAWHVFVNSDQGVDPNSWNQNNYAGGSPIMNADPSGLMQVQVDPHDRPPSWQNDGDQYFGPEVNLESGDLGLGTSAFDSLIALGLDPNNAASYTKVGIWNNNLSNAVALFDPMHVSDYGQAVYLFWGRNGQYLDTYGLITKGQFHGEGWGLYVSPQTNTDSGSSMFDRFLDGYQNAPRDAVLPRRIFNTISNIQTLTTRLVWENAVESSAASALGWQEGAMVMSNGLVWEAMILPAFAANGAIEIGKITAGFTNMYFDAYRK